MRTEIKKLISLKQFFKVIQSDNSTTLIHLEKPSKILLQNIHHSWLKSIQGKTATHFPIYLNENVQQKCKRSLYGFIKEKPAKIDDILIEHNSDTYSPSNSKELKLNLIVPQPDVMQYFIQWQRYRKYWWSSITTTPSLFSINEMKHGVQNVDVDIIANFTWGPYAVESISINTSDSDTLNVNDSTSMCHLTCTMGLENALLTLLLDAISNATKEDYLRLHTKMAPYKISFALDSKDMKTLKTLKELAQLIFHKLCLKQISGWLPNFLLPLQEQINENLRMGISYTAILNENTLSNGIFHLLNSSTMLKEQVHVADFDEYAALLCKKY